MVLWLRKLVSIFVVPSGAPELLLSQYAAVAKHVPLLYSTILFNTVVVAALHIHTAPTRLTLVMPAFLVVVGVSRVMSWYRRPRLIDAATALRCLRFTAVVSAALGPLFIAWALSLYPYGDVYSKMHVVYFISITVIAGIFCLMYLPAAAFGLTVTVAMPAIVYFVLTREPALIAISVNFLLVTVCMIVILVRQFRSFVALVDSKRQIVVRQAETQLLSDANSRLASIDTLTGLPNRRAFFHDLEAALQAGGAGEIAVGLLDLDGFKPINDGFGHAVGDAVLQEAGRRMQSFAAPGRSFARLGGDEFGFIMSGLGQQAAMSLVEEFCRVLRAPYGLQSVTVEISASVGVAVYPDAGEGVAQLFENADYALYYAKQNRRGCPVLFSPVHQHEIREAARLEQTLRHADFETELSLAFQPIVDADTGETIAFECLARWNSPDLGPVPPNDFIKAAERMDLINRMTEVLLRKALAAARHWPERVRIAFNLSVRDIASEKSVQRICAIVAASGIAPNRIELEITETAVMRDFEQSRQTLHLLKELGVQIALDDFGTGYSSLSYVHRLPLDKIKVDRSFIADIETDPACLNIIKTVIDLSRNLKLRCVVEGLETASQVRILKVMGCGLMQGYFFARPMTAEAVSGYLDAEARRLNPLLECRPPVRMPGLPNKASAIKAGV